MNVSPGVQRTLVIREVECELAAAADVRHIPNRQHPVSSGPLPVVGQLLLGIMGPFLAEGRGLHETEATSFFLGSRVCQRSRLTLSFTKSELR